MLKTFRQFLFEMAVPLSVYKDFMRTYLKDWSPKEKYFEIFSHYNTGPRKNKKPYRIYLPDIPLDKSEIKVEQRYIDDMDYLFHSAKRYLRKYFWVENYVLGIAREEGNDKNLYKIGKILNKIEEEHIKDRYGIENYKKMLNELKKYDKKTREGRAMRKKIRDEFFKNDSFYEHFIKVKSEFENHPSRKLVKESTYTIVISHHSYDIIGMTHNRGWASCMKLDTPRETYIAADVREGTIIAYAVRNDDLNIQKPVCRILIKPYISTIDENKFILVPEKRVYGSEIKNFKKVVENWVNEVNEKFLAGKVYGIFSFKSGLYNDGCPYEIVNLPKNKEDFIKFVKSLSKSELEKIKNELRSILYHPDFTDEIKSIIQTLEELGLLELKDFIRFSYLYTQEKILDLIQKISDEKYYGSVLDMVDDLDHQTKDALEDFIANLRHVDDKNWDTFKYAFLAIYGKNRAQRTLSLDNDQRIKLAEFVKKSKNLSLYINTLIRGATNLDTKLKLFEIYLSSAQTDRFFSLKYVNIDQFPFDARFKKQFFDFLDIIVKHFDVLDKKDKRILGEYFVRNYKTKLVIEYARSKNDYKILDVFIDMEVNVNFKKFTQEEIEYFKQKNIFRVKETFDLIDKLGL